MGHLFSLKLMKKTVVLGDDKRLNATRQGLNRGDRSANPSSDVDSVVPNLEHGLEYEDETDAVGSEAQERMKREIEWVGAGICKKRP